MGSEIVSKGTICICKNCGKQFIAPGNTTGQYCNKKCRYEDHSNIIKASYDENLRNKKRILALKQMKDSKQRQIRSKKLKGIKRSQEVIMKNSEAHKKHVDYREIAFSKKECKCERCGKELPKEKLVVHHINGEHYIDDLTDNTIDNLMILCRSCHTKLHHEQKDFVRHFTGETDFEKAANLILSGIKKMGFELDDDNFKDTPKRVARAYTEIFDGCADLDRKVNTILSTAFPSECDSMVLETGITTFSMCPHHLLPVEYKVSIAYIPAKDGKVLGISKLTRLAEILAKRPALQEDYTQDIANAIEKLNVEGVAVVVEGQHMCMRMRGVRNPSGVVSTSVLRGAFRENSATRQEFYELIKGRPKFKD